MTAPLIPVYTGDPPQRTQPQEVFSQNVDSFLSYQLPLASSYNAMAGYINGLALQVDSDSVAAAASAAAAAASASALNYSGVWSSLSGALSLGSSVEHKSAIWLLKVDLVDVSASEPGVTSDWLVINGVRFVEPVAGGILSVSFVNRITLSDTFNLPVAANTQNGAALSVAILEVDSGITPFLSLSGGDSATDGRKTVTDGVLYARGFSGVDVLVSNGVDAWEF